MLKIFLKRCNVLKLSDYCTKQSITTLNCSLLLHIEKDITIFLAHYCSRFLHADILPKMHILEDHVVPWLRKWHVGAGLIREQGAESLHTRLHSLDRNFPGISNELD